MWDKVQARLNSRNVTRRSGSSHRSRYALSGLVRCGHCGGTMWGKTTTSKHDGKVFSNVYYRCGKYESYGRTGCKPLTMPNRPLERYVESVIRRRILVTPPARIGQTAARQLGRLTDKAADQKRELEILERQIKMATERYLTITDEHAATAAKATLDRLTQKAHALRGQAQPAEVPKAADVEGQIQKVVAEVRKLSEMIRSGSAELKQRVYQTLIESIDLYFAPAEEGPRSYVFERGVIKFKQVAAVAAATCRVGRGGRI
ncbi:MAG: recombinase zinc beta ribbon domain-containing protein [Candidatus Brocadiia bacterium]